MRQGKVERNFNFSGAGDKLDCFNWNLNLLVDKDVCLFSTVTTAYLISINADTGRVVFMVSCPPSLLLTKKLDFDKTAHRVLIKAMDILGSHPDLYYTI